MPEININEQIVPTNAELKLTIIVRLLGSVRLTIFHHHPFFIHLVGTIYWETGTYSDISSGVSVKRS